MKPETAAFLEKARESLGKAQGMLDNQWPDEARGGRRIWRGCMRLEPLSSRAPVR
jgi:hypothetical protein